MACPRTGIKSNGPTISPALPPRRKAREGVRASIRSRALSLGNTFQQVVLGASHIQVADNGRRALLMYACVGATPTADFSAPADRIDEKLEICELFQTTKSGAGIRVSDRDQSGLAVCLLSSDAQMARSTEPYGSLDVTVWIVALADQAKPPSMHLRDPVR